MKLTKEECFKALNDIKVDGISYCIDFCSNKDGAIEKRKLHFEGLKTIEQLINEYFELTQENKRLQRFKDYFDDLYNTGLEVANWHLNGSLEPFDSFYDSAMEWGERDETK